MQRIHVLLLSVALAGGLFLAAPAQAQQASTSFNVTATVGAACLVLATDLAFGSYDGTVLAGSTTLSFECTQTVNATLTFTGSNPNADPSDGFAMVDGNNNVLDYTIAFDPSQQDKLTSGVPVDVQVPQGVLPADFFGEIPANQQVPEGNYADAVIVQLDF
jgi:spore coat protein U-like protein